MSQSLDQIFSTVTLNLLIPDTSLEFPPPQDAVHKWLAKAQTAEVDRQQAFFDEQLQSLLVLRIEHPEEISPDTHNPPNVLLDLLAHIQVSLEATYISPVLVASDTPRTSRLLATPKTGAFARATGRLSTHPSILPPKTPNPMPATANQDRKYTTAEGTLLAATIWGANVSEDSPEAFTLLWSEEDAVWLAVYRIAITVSFLRLTFSDPLLCLTVSATLREKTLSISPKHPIATWLASLGGRRIPALEPPSEPQGRRTPSDDPSLLDGLDEINLLDGLLAGPTFAKLGSSELNLPSLRLGKDTRENLFSLPPTLADTPVAPSPSPMTAVRKAHPTLRKSFRKTLQTVSGFRVRMRTVFVPFVLLPETEGIIADLDEEEKERERKEAGNEERTVVLCVEIENSGDLGNSAGFLVEQVQVNIGGDGATATLIGWGDHGFTADAAKKTFPLHVAPLAQYNLLYAVSFTRSPDEIDSFSFARNVGAGLSPELQRAVTINIFGKPFFPPSPTPLLNSLTDPVSFSYPTRTFSSKWNCVLDLASQQPSGMDMLDDLSGNYPSVLPEPASPFPVFATGAYSSRTTGTPFFPGADSTTPQYSATAGSKRFSLAPGASFAGRTLKNLTPNRSSLRPEQSPMISGRPNSQIAMSNPNSAAYLRSPTTYSAPPPVSLPPISVPGQGPPGKPLHLTIESADYHQTGLALTTGALDTPVTPAFPAFPPKSALPPTPMSQGPVASASMANFSNSVEIRRERGLIHEHVGAGGALPPTPLPRISGAFGEQKMLSKLQNASVGGENIVVSVGLSPLSKDELRDQNKTVLGPGRIYPLDVFTLDIFVFNQSSWPRRLEVTCPERRRRRRGGTESGVYDGNKIARKMGYPGVLPMDSRVRIGPLLPAACQSVRMNFLAVTPGVHSIDTLTLMDIETGFSMNLRSILDVVVHDPRD